MRGDFGKSEVETINVPSRFVDIVERRTRAIVRAAMHDGNVLRSIALSCYLQGLEDGALVATSRALPDREERER